MTEDEVDASVPSLPRRRGFRVVAYSAGGLALAGGVAAAVNAWGAGWAAAEAIGTVAAFGISALAIVRGEADKRRERAQLRRAQASQVFLVVADKGGNVTNDMLAAYFEVTVKNASNLPIRIVGPRLERYKLSVAGPAKPTVVFSGFETSQGLLPGEKFSFSLYFEAKGLAGKLHRKHEPNPIVAVIFEDAANVVWHRTSDNALEERDVLLRRALEADLRRINAEYGEEST